MAIHESSFDSTSDSLIRRLREEDPRAWERLVELYGPLVFHWCRRLGLDAPDAADMLQEVLTTVTMSIAGFRGRNDDGSFRGWLWTITRNKVRNHFRKRDVAQATGGTQALRALQCVPAETLEESEVTDPKQLAALFHRALGMIREEFEKNTWQAFWRVVVEEQPTEAIATDLGMSRNAVRQAKYRVLRRLREELGEQPGANNEAQETQDEAQDEA